MENWIGLDVHISFGGPNLLWVVLHQEGAGDHQVFGIKVIGIGNILEVRGHLPNEQIPGLHGLWFSIQGKVHPPGFAEKVDVILSVEIVRFIRIRQRVIDKIGLVHTTAKIARFVDFSVNLCRNGKMSKTNRIPGNDGKRIAPYLCGRKQIKAI